MVVDSKLTERLLFYILTRSGIGMDSIHSLLGSAEGKVSSQQRNVLFELSLDWMSVIVQL